MSKKIDFTFHIDMTGRRWSSSTPNVQFIPKEEFKGVNYGEMEPRIFAMMFPGADGIGADIIPDFLQGEEQPRKIGMSPVLGMPYGLAADILRMEDVIYEQFDPYVGTRPLRAKVLKFDANKDSAEIEFEDKSLIPPTMWVPVRSLKQAWGGRVVNIQTHCPKCEIPWKETMLARFSCWDCPACGAKKEDHCK